jgi:hypothetical protein
LDELVFEVRDADRPFLAVVLVDPHPFYHRRYIVLVFQSPIEVVQVVLQVRGVVLRRDAAQPRCPVLAGPVVSFSKKVLVHQVGEGRKYPLRMVARLLCNLLELC